MLPTLKPITLGFWQGLDRLERAWEEERRQRREGQSNESQKGGRLENEAQFIGRKQLQCKGVFVLASAKLDHGQSIGQACGSEVE